MVERFEGFIRQTVVEIRNFSQHVFIEARSDVVAMYLKDRNC